MVHALNHPAVKKYHFHSSGWMVSALQAEPTLRLHMPGIMQMSSSWASAVGGTLTHHRTQQYLPAYFMPQLHDLLRNDIFIETLPCKTDLVFLLLTLAVLSCYTLENHHKNTNRKRHAKAEDEAWPTSLLLLAQILSERHCSDRIWKHFWSWLVLHEMAGAKLLAVLDIEAKSLGKYYKRLQLSLLLSATLFLPIGQTCGFQS